MSPAIGTAHRRRLREIGRSAGWPCQDLLGVELLAAGLLERVHDGHSLKVRRGDKRATCLDVAGECGYVLRQGIAAPDDEQQILCDQGPEQFRIANTFESRHDPDTHQPLHPASDDRTA